MLRGKSWDDGWLTAYWGRDGRGEPKELMFGFPCKTDGHLLNDVFAHARLSGGKTLLKELEARGYDISTVQFSIKRKYRPNEPAATGGKPL